MAESANEDLTRMLQSVTAENAQLLTALGVALDEASAADARAQDLARQVAANEAVVTGLQERLREIARIAGA
jgi:hypothetical protein